MLSDFDYRGTVYDHTKYLTSDYKIYLNTSSLQSQLFPATATFTSFIPLQANYLMSLIKHLFRNLKECLFFYYLDVCQWK